MAARLPYEKKIMPYRVGIDLWDLEPGTRADNGFLSLYQLCFGWNLLFEPDTPKRDHSESEQNHTH